MQENSSKGSASFAASIESASEFADFFAKMASSSSDEITEGVSFADFNSFVSKAFGEDGSGIAQRIEAKAKEARKAEEAAKEAARAA